MLSKFLRSASANKGAILEYIGFSEAVNLNGSTVTCDVPTGAIAGDLLIGVSTQTGSSTVYAMTPPSGWTELLDAQAIWVGYLPAWDGTTSSYDFVKSNALADPAVAVYAFRNATFDVLGTPSALSTSPVAPSITLTESGSIVLATYRAVTQTTTTYSTPTDFTSINNGSGTYALSSFIKEGVASGATGTVSSTPSPSINSRGFLIGIKQT